jgi:succinylglutamate desuccinylase
MSKLFVGLFFIPMIVNAYSYCDEIDENSRKNQINIDAVHSGYKVFGRGRLYFHSAPDKQCITKNVYVVNGDQVDAYVEHGNYMLIMYFNNDGKEYDGWVEKRRLKATNQNVGH